MLEFSCYVYPYTSTIYCEKGTVIETARNGIELWILHFGIESYQITKEPNFYA